MHSREIEEGPKPPPVHCPEGQARTDRRPENALQGSKSQTPHRTKSAEQRGSFAKRRKNTPLQQDEQDDSQFPIVVSRP